MLYREYLKNTIQQMLMSQEPLNVKEDLAVLVKVKAVKADTADTAETAVGGE